MQIKRALAVATAAVTIGCGRPTADPCRDVASALRTANQQLAESRKTSEQLSRKLKESEEKLAALTTKPEAAPATLDDPPPDATELAAANDFFSPSIQSFCRDQSFSLAAAHDTPTVAEAKCLEREVPALEKLMKGRPLGVGISANTFGRIRVRCAKSFPRDLAMRAYCEDQLIRRAAP